MKPSEWLQNFLRDRNLTTPDGRRFYEYRISKAEYAALEQALIRSSINHDSYQGWDSCFVLYASEWWRRNYTSGPWSWGPILESLGKSIDSTATRSQLVECGVRKLKRKILIDDSGKRDLLVTMIIECGIPIETLKKDRHWLKKLITDSFKGYYILSSSEIDVTEFVRLQADSIPKSIRREAVFDLVGRIVVELKNLRATYQLQKQRSPVEFLDGVKPDWRSIFPIQLDSEISKRFLDELLSEIAAFVEPRAYPFRFIRVAKLHNDNWELHAHFKIPFGYYDHDDLKISEEELNGFPDRVDVSLVDPTGKSHLIAVGLKTSKDGRTQIRMEGEKLVTSDLAYDEWQLQISHFGAVRRLVLPGSEPINREAPLTFLLKENEWQLQSQASFKTTADKALILMDKKLQWDGSLDMIGTVEEWAAVFILQGTANITNKGNLYRICTKQNAEEKFQYVVAGTLLPFPTVNSNEVYMGVPSICRQNTDTLTKTPSNGITEIRSVGHGNSWHTPADADCGVCEIRHIGKDGEVLLNRKLSILPKNFGIISTARELGNGIITLSNSSSFDVSISPNTINSKITRTEYGHELELNTTSDIPAEKVIIGLRRKDSQRDIKIAIPFPANGAKFFDSDGRLLRRNDTIFFEDLRGSRLYLFNSSSNAKTFVVKLTLHDPRSAERQDLEKQFYFSVDSSWGELPLIDLGNEIKSLFVTNLDATVRIKVSETIGTEAASIHVKRYANEKLVVEPTSGRIWLDTDVEFDEELKLSAFRLDVPFGTQEIDHILPHPNGPSSVYWDFMNSTRAEGVWLIFPSKSCKRLFRPKAWTVGSKQQEDAQVVIENISDAAYLGDEDLRIRSLQMLFERISEIYDDQNWKEVDEILIQTDHLALTTLNMWTGLARCPKALPTLFLRNETAAEKLTQEFPVLWECLPISYWLHSFELFHQHYKVYPEEICASIVNKKVEALGDLLGMEFLVFILKHKLTGEAVPHYFDIKFSTILQGEIKAAYGGRNGMPGLCHFDGEWPVHLKEDILEAIKSLPKEVLSLFPQGEPNHRKSVMYLPALLAYKTINRASYPNSPSTNQVLKMRILKEFNSVWFKYIFNVVQGFCWVNKIK